jgi:hypothetical protein
MAEKFQVQQVRGLHVLLGGWLRGLLAVRCDGPLERERVGLLAVRQTRTSARHVSRLAANLWRVRLKVRLDPGQPSFGNTPPAVSCLGG